MNLIAPEERPAERPSPKGHLAQIWITCKELWNESIPLWFPLLSVGVAILTVYFSDQATGILQALVDRSSRQDETEQALMGLQRWHYWAFVAALCLWSFVNYQCTYFLHQFDYTSPDHVGRFSDRKGWLGRWFKRLERASPIIAGIGPSIAVALGYGVLRKVYSLAGESLSVGQSLPLYLPSILIVALIIWRPFTRWMQDAKRGHSRQLNEKLSKMEIGLSLLLLAIIALLVAATLLAPQMWAVIGAAATLCVIATVFVAFGSFLVFWGGRWRLPLIFLTFAYCVAISFWNDNHSVRVIRDASRAETFPEFEIRSVLDAWIKQLRETEKDRKPNQKTPLFVICAEGGGVRAAYWAAQLLAYLEDTTRHYPNQFVPFSSRVLLISGVSGGSLGAATFDALLDSSVSTKPTDSDWFGRHTTNFLGRDQLSAPLATAAFIDTTQRLFPYPFFDKHDRAAALEAAWEQAWSQSLKSNHDDPKMFCRFDDDFRQIWRRRGNPLVSTGQEPWIPSLFLNGTSVELGGRIIASDCVISTGDYPGAQDALYLLNLRGNSKYHHMQPGALRVSSAINLSTRFPGISPSGELSGDDEKYPQRIVDGGYYDNSGARTAWDNLVAVYYNRLRDPKPDDIIPWVIVIRAGPESKRQTPDLPRHHSERLDLIPTAIRPTPSHFMVDLLAPARAFLNAWGARSGDSPEALKDGVSLISQRLSMQDTRGPSPQTRDAVGRPPLERVDYSIQTGAANLPGSTSAIAQPHHDPYVIELNLELDEKIDASVAQKTNAVVAPQNPAAATQQKKLLLPLGWMLPAKARDVMKNELTTRLAPPRDLLEEPTHDSEWFRRLQETQLGRVLSLLHRERPTAESELAKPVAVKEPPTDPPKEVNKDGGGGDLGDGSTISPEPKSGSKQSVCSPVARRTHLRQARK